MGTAKIFLKMKPEDRIKYAMKKKQEAERAERFWSKICRKLTSDRDFTPLENDIIDTILEKENPHGKENKDRA